MAGASKKGKEGKEPKSITLDQRRVMVQFIIENPGCNTGNFNCSHNEKAKAETWEKLTSLLNAMPGASKTWQQWMKCFQDWKSECKGKAQHNNIAKNATGNTITLKKISDLEDLCIKHLICETATQGNGSQDPDDDVVSQAQLIQDNGGDGQVLDATLSLVDNGEVAFQLVDGAVHNGSILQVVAAPSRATSTPVSNAKSKNKKTDADLRKEGRKRFRKELELDEDRVVENEQLVAHLAVNNKSADALLSIAKSLEKLVATQDAILDEQRSQSDLLAELLKRLP